MTNNDDFNERLYFSQSGQEKVCDHLNSKFKNEYFVCGKNKVKDIFNNYNQYTPDIQIFKDGQLCGFIEVKTIMNPNNKIVWYKQRYSKDKTHKVPTNLDWNYLKAYNRNNEPKFRYYIIFYDPFSKRMLLMDQNSQIQRMLNGGDWDVLRKGNGKPLLDQKGKVIEVKYVKNFSYKYI